ncbi:unnamed protein product (macronuclear) [Paramecium tetraurelia]|uniref:DH domain-containing protein n=1 Tax=Paramecium tetraurelia TaxID=5888 RepID=A0BTI5_PARTE|nr:uncharacterized protein GSPATT00032084001 [Paramecium tetraurelia]CAK61852.1 unnamed protein product [Paramecium tetraurelia]|eukprot:XP_001429250.1 hypothetical protein (macronuclear) [Paramecium tetraurelia strain d4-2]
MHCDSSDEDDSKFGIGKKFFIQLLEKERKFITKIESMQQILDLLNMYAMCVEFFDTVGNPAKYYFMEKISNTIAEKEAFEIMLKDEMLAREKREKQMQIKPIVKEGLVKYDPLKRPEKPPKPKFQTPVKEEEQQQIQEINIENKKISHKVIREVRSKKLTMTEKIYQSQNEQKVQVDLIKHWDDEVERKDNIIRQSLQQQGDTIQDRVNERLNRLRKQLPSNITSEMCLEKYDT